MIKLDRRHVVGALMGCAALPASAQGKRTPTFVTHAPSELAWILAGLSSLDRGGESLKRDSAYWRAAEAWFAPFAQHPAVIALGGDFNLPRLIGNAANYNFNAAGRLIRGWRSKPMWGDASGDLFTRHLEAIETFASVSRAAIFLALQSETFDSIRATLNAAIDLADMQSWLEQQFSARPAPMQVFVSPVTGGWNFTNLDPVTPRLWVAAIDPPQSEYARFAVVRSIFTEMDHNYVNPVTARLEASAYGFMTLANGWATPEAWADYDSAELVVNEYMTYAAFIAYAQDRIDGEDLARTDAAARQMMQRRGFPRFDAFADALSRARKRSATLEDLYPAVLAAVRG